MVVTREGQSELTDQNEPEGPADDATAQGSLE